MCDDPAVAYDREPCPGCGALLPRADGPTHRYIGASPACWAIYSALLAGGTPEVEILTPPPIPATRTVPGIAAGELLVDAYAAQHPGEPSPQAIQSVAVHLLALHGVLERGVGPGKALWIRLRAVRERGVFRWLDPPSFRDTLTVVHVAGAEPAERGARMAEYVASVYEVWAAAYEETIAGWYVRFVERD